MVGARAVVEQIGNRIELLLAIDLQVRVLGQVLANQPVDVLAGAKLLGAVLIAEGQRHTGVRRQLGMAAHFLALILSKGLGIGSATMRCLAVKPSSSEADVASTSLISVTRRELRSSKSPTPNRLPAPLMRLPSQCPRKARSLGSGGRTCILSRSGIWPQQSSPRLRGIRLALAQNRQAIRSLHDFFLG